MEYCTDLALYHLLKVIKTTFIVIQIVVPILLLVMSIVMFIKLMSNPDEKKYEKKIVNNVIACIIVFFIPVLINVTMGMLGERFDVSECWNLLSSNMGPSKYIDNGKDRTNIIDFDKEYETGEDKNSVISGDSQASNGSKTYNEYHLLRTFKLDDLQKQIVVNSSKGCNVSQSLVVTDKHYVVATICYGNKDTRIQIFNKNNERINVIGDDLYHANGMTYNSQTGKIYVATMKGGNIVEFSYQKIVNGSRLEKRNFSFSKDISGIAYDDSVNKYYLAKGSNIYVADSNFNYIKTIKKIRTGTPQDIGAYNGVVYVISQLKGKCSIDLYRSKDGAYLGSYEINFSGEVESLDYDHYNKQFAILFNAAGNPDYIYTTKELVIP